MEENYEVVENVEETNELATEGTTDNDSSTKIDAKTVILGAVAVGAVAGAAAGVAGKITSKAVDAAGQGIYNLRRKLQDMRAEAKAKSEDKKAEREQRYQESKAKAEEKKNEKK